MSLERCRLIDLPRHNDTRGSLSYVERGGGLPFEIQRVYYLYDVPAGGSRGEHGHRRLEQLFIAMAGAFDVMLDDGRARRTFRLDRPDHALYVCPMMWRELSGFAPGSVCLVLASHPYEEADYIFDYEEFRECVTRP